MNKTRILILSIIAVVTLFSISYVHAQTSSVPSLDGQNFNPVKYLKPIAGTARVISSGTVNVANLTGSKHASLAAIHPPHPRDVLSYKKYQKLLSSGKLYTGIPLVPETPIASMAQKYPVENTVAATGFPGFEQNDNNTSYPPDVQIAAGPDDIMEMVNTQGGIWTKQGVLVKQFPLSLFFALSDDHLISDPRVIYDMQSGRWFAELLDQTNSTISVAVSQTSDPEANWNIYKIFYSSQCVDFPKIGTSDDKLVVSTNDFDPSCITFDESEMVVLDKGQLMTHSLQVGSSDLDQDQFSVTPAKSLSSTSDLYMIANDLNGTGNQVTVYKLQGPAEYVTMSSNYTSTATIQRDPPTVPQNNTSAMLNTPPHGFEDAAWFDGTLWSAFTDACRPSEGFADRVYSCIHLFRYDTNTASSLDFEIANHDYNFSYPAITIDGRGGLDIVMSQVSSDSYPGIFVTGQTTYDMPNYVEPLVQVIGGSTFDSSCRYGDYFSASPDPSNPFDFWLAGEYSHLGNTFDLQIPCDGSTTSPAWSTYVAQTSMWHYRFLHDIMR